jgi:Holliday junction resolvase RusA-like endonuclease
MVSAPPAISFFVRGTPVTKGSLRPWHKWRPGGLCVLGLTEDNGARLKEWRALVATAAKQAAKHEPPLTGPVKVGMTFYFERPKADRSGSEWVAVRGRNDVEKLVRAIHDACTDAAVWMDDGQVAVLRAEKRYCDGFEQPGVMVAVAAL